jgi:hypothetical protein
MGRAFDERHRKLLRQVFADRASNVPDFTRTARTGGHRSDEGYDNLLPAELTERGKVAAIKQAILDFLVDEKIPSVEDSKGDAGMQLDPGLFFHFRVAVCGVRLFIKVLLDDDDPDEPEAVVISVKRDDGAWK